MHKDPRSCRENPVSLRWIVQLIVALALLNATSLAAAQQFRAISSTRNKAVLWIAPQDIPSRNLLYGLRNEKSQSSGPFTFLKEDLGGTSPKFDVRDSSGDKWKAKLGYEAQPETVATRLLWAVGFITNENYFLPETIVRDLPRLHRGGEFVKDESVKGVRLQRHSAGKKVGNWSWRHNPFIGTREFNGLRVMMALLSNWDLKDENNAVYETTHDSDRQFYEVSDLGASFGRSGKSYSDSITKHNPGAYHRSKFISKVTSDHVDFAFPTHPPFLFVFNLPYFIGQMRNRWIGKHIPREDARWVGSLLAQLSPEQIRDAFRAGGYSKQEVDEYSEAITARIAELQRL